MNGSLILHPTSEPLPSFSRGKGALRVLSCRLNVSAAFARPRNAVWALQFLRPKGRIALCIHPDFLFSQVVPERYSPILVYKVASSCGGRGPSAAVTPIPLTCFHLRHLPHLLDEDDKSLHHHC